MIHLAKKIKKHAAQVVGFAAIAPFWIAVCSIIYYHIIFSGPPRKVEDPIH